MNEHMTPHDALARLVAAVEKVKSAAVLVTSSRDHLIQARNDLQAALGAGADQAEQERDALRSTVADLIASLKVAQESLRQREAAQRVAEEKLAAQIQAAYVAQEAQIAQGWKLHEAEEQIAALRAALRKYGMHQCLKSLNDLRPKADRVTECTCGLDAAREG